MDLSPNDEKYKNEMYDFLRLENLKGDFKNLLDAVRGGKATTAFSLVQGAKTTLQAQFLALNC
ncbi:MAG: hypothetical protein L6V82_02480 [Clostridiales bacterium]|nr:MAG: hypothetical protein L6V82_02480 [Clostridiales bacterium]